MSMDHFFPSPEDEKAGANPRMVMVNERNRREVRRSSRAQRHPEVGR